MATVEMSYNGVEELVMDEILQRQDMTVRALAESLDRSPPTIRRALKTLMSEGKIERHGQGKQLYYNAPPESVQDGQEGGLDALMDDIRAKTQEMQKTFPKYSKHQQDVLHDWISQRWDDLVRSVDDTGENFSLNDTVEDIYNRYCTFTLRILQSIRMRGEDQLRADIRSYLTDARIIFDALVKTLRDILQSYEKLSSTRRARPKKHLEDLHAAIDHLHYDIHQVCERVERQSDVSDSSTTDHPDIRPDVRLIRRMKDGRESLDKDISRLVRHMESGTDTDLSDEERERMEQNIRDGTDILSKIKTDLSAVEEKITEAHRHASLDDLDRRTSRTVDSANKRLALCRTTLRVVLGEMSVEKTINKDGGIVACADMGDGAADIHGDWTRIIATRQSVILIILSGDGRQTRQQRYAYEHVEDLTLGDRSSKMNVLTLTVPPSKPRQTRVIKIGVLPQKDARQVYETIREGARLAQGRHSGGGIGKKAGRRTG